MTALIEIKKRSQVVENVCIVTKVMQMIALSKMNKVKNKILIAKEYSSQSDILIKNALSNQFIKRKIVKPSSDTFVHIVFGSDSGFCGGTNTNIVRQVDFSNKNAEFIFFGKKIITLIKKDISIYRSLENKENCIPLETNDVKNRINGLCNILYKDLQKNKIKCIKLSYLDFRNVAYSEYREEIILEGIDMQVESLIKVYLKSKLYCAYLSTLGTVLSNRIKSMDSSSQNAKAMSDYLKVYYNKTRQYKVNLELLDIISGSM